MAAIITLKSGQRIYTVSKSVGYKGSSGTCANAQDDVLLVQYLLRERYQKLKSNKPLGATLQVDGIFGQQTHYWILFHEWRLVEAGGKGDILTGSIEPITTGTGLRIDDPMWHLTNGWGLKNLAEASDIPAVLRNALKTNALTSASSISGDFGIAGK